MVVAPGQTLATTGDGSAVVAPPGTGPHLFVVVECDRLAAGGTRHDLSDLAIVHLGRGVRRTAARAGDALTLAIPDARMSGEHARLTPSFGRWVVEDSRSKNGTLVNGAEVSRHPLADGDVITLGHTLLLYRDDLERAERPDVDTAVDDPPLPGFHTAAPSLARELGRVQQLAGSDIALLIRGESGSGKEVLARAIHAASARAGELVAVNCGAIPANLVESELFGAKRGAFSGAVADRRGIVRSADHGTLFLDEIADLPASSQAALLRVLQEREVRPIGGERAVPVDIRLVSATHRELRSLVDAGRFRDDLYARVAGYTIALPPLRERVHDLGTLIAAMLPRIAGERAAGARIEPEAALVLARYPWPHNVRELAHCLTTALALAEDAPIARAHLLDAVRAGALDGASEPGELVERAQQREAVVGALRRHGGNISAAARELGKHRKQIQRWIKLFDIDKDAFR